MPIFNNKQTSQGCLFAKPGTSPNSPLLFGGNWMQLLKCLTPEFVKCGLAAQNDGIAWLCKPLTKPHWHHHERPTKLSKILVKKCYFFWEHCVSMCKTQKQECTDSTKSMYTVRERLTMPWLMKPCFLAMRSASSWPPIIWTAQVLV